VTTIPRTSALRSERFTSKRRASPSNRPIAGPDESVSTRHQPRIVSGDVASSITRTTRCGGQVFAAASSSTSKPHDALSPLNARPPTLIESRWTSDPMLVQEPRSASAPISIVRVTCPSRSGGSGCPSRPARASRG
jgi:hypothetical protein